MRILTLILAIFNFGIFTSNAAVASEGRKGPPFRNITHPIVDDRGPPGARALHPLRSVTVDLMKKIGPVKDQADRGTCSIFASTALLESMLILSGALPPHSSLSEEWLEYLITRRTHFEGSDAHDNLMMLTRFGSVPDRMMPYIGETWSRRDYSPLSTDRCAKAAGPVLRDCLLGHRDPRLLNEPDGALLDAKGPFFDPELERARASAVVFQKRFLAQAETEFKIRSTSEVKFLLSHGIPVIVELDFFDGAWNHSDGPAHGIHRSMDQWYRGIVGYPEVGSVDRTQGLRAKDGHSVLIVGYDDDLEVSTSSVMNDGSVQKFSYKGVYYFKNSWGTESFGSHFELEGERFPGYGMMTQAYAHEFGGFYKLKVAPNLW